MKKSADKRPVRTWALRPHWRANTPAASGAGVVVTAISLHTVAGGVPEHRLPQWQAAVAEARPPQGESLLGMQLPVRKQAAVGCQRSASTPKGHHPPLSSLVSPRLLSRAALSPFSKSRWPPPHGPGQTGPLRCPPCPATPLPCAALLPRVPLPRPPRCAAQSTPRAPQTWPPASQS